MTRTRFRLVLSAVAIVVLGTAGGLQAGFSFARDPGVRGGPPGAGGALGGLSPTETAFFTDGQDAFEEAEGVGDGLGPRFNLDSCAGCHTQPATGGTSPAMNPQVAVATAFDGGVHALFVISGRNDPTGDAGGCTAMQEDFETQVRRGNVIFRTPTPTFGAGLIEMVPDHAIVDNLAANTMAKKLWGIHGRPHRVSVTGDPNHNGNDGTIARFGWKAQNKSLLLFSGEAYNVEMGISNELFQSERDENPTCQFATVPNDTTDTNAAGGTATISDVEKFSFFMRFLDAPAPSPDTPGGAGSITRGRMVFGAIGCALCHTPTLRTGNTTVVALRNRDVNLFSDLALHQMGPGLADNVAQGQARGDEFRSAPLWGLGQRIFFLHDGRTTDLIEAIRAHRSAGNAKFGPSEANGVVDAFNRLNEGSKQDLLNFLRSL